MKLTEQVAATEYAINFSLNLHAIRKRVGVSQRQLATAIGKEPSFISHLEAGRRHATVITLIDLAVVLGVEPGAFFEEPAP